MQSACSHTLAAVRVSDQSRLHDSQDTARFKYPPHWVPLPELYAAMFDRVDPVSRTECLLLL